MKEYKRFLTGTFLAAVLVLICCLALPMQASAETEGCFTYYVYDGEVTIADCIEDISGKVTIPATLGGYPVTTIGGSAFANCSGMTAVAIPDSVASIGQGAFYNCTGLEAVYITDIAAWCAIEFSYSSNPLGYAKNLYLNDVLVTDLIIPDGVTAISNYAFSSYANLTSVTIPDSVTSIGKYTFSYCNLSYNTYDIGNYLGNDENPYHVLMEIPYIYSNSTECTLHPDTKVIADEAFYFGKQLTSVSIPDSVTSIGEDAFRWCGNLNAVYITDIAAWCAIDFRSQPLDYAENLYLNDVLVTDLMIPDGVTAISHSAFSGYANLTSVTIPNSATSIGYSAFEKCTGLTSVTIPDSVTTIGGSAFSYCAGLNSVTIGDGVTTIGSNAFYNCTGLTSVTIPDSVISIGNFAFRECIGLTEMRIGNGVTSIGQGMLERCTSLNAVYITDIAAWCAIDFDSNPLNCAENLYLNDVLVTDLIIPDGVTVISHSAFSGYANLTSVTIPDSVTSIEWYAFHDCTGLTSVTLGNGVTTIGGDAFYNCNSLTSVTIPDSVTTIDNYAFYNCTGLTSVTIPGSVTDIGYRAFGKCTGLTSVIFDGGAINIGDEAFKQCENLASVSMSDNVQSIGEMAFYNCGKLTYNTYDNALYLGNEGNPYVALIQSVSWNITSCQIHKNTKTIAACAFNGNSKLTEITIPAGVNTIGSYALENCSNLTSITVAEENSSYSSDNRGVLFNKEKTELIKAPEKLGGSYTVPDSVTEISDCAFSSCSDLVIAKIPDTVTDIAYAAFYGCTDLSKLELPESVTSIGDVAFEKCDSLTDVFYTGTEVQWNDIDVGWDNDCLTDATIHFQTEMPILTGDLDGSGYINEDDAIYLLQHVLMPDLFPIEHDADYDSGGTIDEDDAIYLLQHVLMPELFPL